MGCQREKALFGRGSEVSARRLWKALFSWMIVAPPQELGLVGKADCVSCRPELIQVPHVTFGHLQYARPSAECFPVYWLAQSCGSRGDQLVLFAQDFHSFKTEILGSKEAPQPWANLGGWSSSSSHTGKFCLMVTPSIVAKTTLLIAPHLCFLFSALER